MFLRPIAMQRYLMSSFIAPFLVALGFFVSFLLTFQLFRIIKIVISKDVEAMVVLEIIGHISLSFLPMAIPLSVLFATIYTLNRLSEDSEIVAMRSFGLPKSKLLLPFLMVGLLIAWSIFSLGNEVIPASKSRFKNTLIQLTSKGALSDIPEENFYLEIPGVTLYATEVDNDTKQLRNVFIQLSKDELAEQVIFAKRGTLIKQQDDEWDIPSLRLHLRDGNILRQSEGRTEKILFREYDFPILDGGSNNDYVTKDSMRTSSQLRHEIRTITKERNEAQAQKMTPEKLENTLNNLTARQARSELEYWSRLNVPIQVLLFIFLGFALGVKKGRGASRNTSATGLIVIAIYYTVFFGLVSFVKKGEMSASLAVFVPTLIGFVYATYVYRRLDWQG